MFDGLIIFIDIMDNFIDIMDNFIDMMGVFCDLDVVYYEYDIQFLFNFNCVFSGCYDVVIVQDGVDLSSYEWVIVIVDV